MQSTNDYDSDHHANNPPRDTLLQVLQIKPLPLAANSVERWRIVLSDSANFIQAMVSTQLNDLISSQKLQKGSLIKLISYTVNKMKERRIVVLLETEVQDDPPFEKVGTPVSMDPIESTGATTNQPGASNTSSFYNNQTTTVDQVQNNRPNGAQQMSRPLRGLDEDAAMFPIESLSPYQNRWTIKARCITKSDIKQWHNQKGEGKLFSCTFMDESGEIRATGFNDAVDNFYQLLQEGNVYTVSKCRVNIAKKQFNNVNNEYELMFERDTEISPCDNAQDVPQVKFKFLALSNLDSVEKDATVDVIAVVKDIGEVGEITSKTTSKPYSKRDLQVVDESGFSVKLTVWGKQATTDFNLKGDEIVAFKGLRVSDFGGRSLSMSNSSFMQVDPEIPEAYSLKGWYEAAGKSKDFTTHNTKMSMGAATARADPRKTLEQVRVENLGLGETPDYFTTSATITFIKKDNASYPACRSEGCNKKVLEDGEGGWRCEKCDKSHDSPEYRYILTITAADFSGSQWFQCFDDVGRTIIGMDATKLQALKEEENEAFEKAVSEAMHKQYIFKVQAKQDNYNGSVRVRYSVRGIAPMDYDAEIALLETEIAAMETSG